MYQLLDTVALTRDITTQGLCRDDIGAVVEILGTDTLMVEFVAASGRTRALLNLQFDDVRPIGDQDQVSIRRVPAGRQ
jgi:hypothetical protein